jgi:hypothetical protein
MAGASETVVSPPARGTFLIGPMKPSAGLHDDLYARALVLACGDTKAALVTVDYLGFDLEFNDELVFRIHRATGIPCAHILINCSHNHGAPVTVPWGPWEEKRDKPHHQTLRRRLPAIVKEALGRLQAVRVDVRREPVQIGFNRRLMSGGRIVMAPNPGGVVVPWVDVVSFVNNTEGRVAVLFSHAAHPVIVHASSTLISADYPGFAVQHLRRSQNPGCIFLFTQGCAGNINAFPLKGGIEAAEAAGRELAGAVNRALEKSTEVLPAPFLRLAELELDLPLQAPPAVEAILRMLEKETDPGKRARREALLEVARSGEQRTLRYPLRGLALGSEFCLMALSHEPFAEYGHFANEASPFRHNMVLGYTGGLECYVGTAEDYRLGERGGYETSPTGAALMFESRLPLAPECEQRIREGIIRVLKRLSDSKGSDP